jgi:hypothetical protein
VLRQNPAFVPFGLSDTLSSDGLAPKVISSATETTSKKGAPRASAKSSAKAKNKKKKKTESDSESDSDTPTKKVHKPSIKALLKAKEKEDKAYCPALSRSAVLQPQIFCCCLQA